MTIQYEVSSFCGQHGCVAVKNLHDGRIAIGDNKLDGGYDLNPIIASSGDYANFTAGIRVGRFNYDTLTAERRKSSFGARNCLQVWLMPDGMVALREGNRPGVIKYYTETEWRDYIKGVKDGQLTFELDRAA